MPPVKEEVVEIELSLLMPYKERDAGDLETLKGSIISEGIIEPLIVGEKNDQGFYPLYVGYRRYLVGKQAGLRTVPCIIRQIKSPNSAVELAESANKNIDELEADYLRLSENNGRKDFSPIEESRILADLKEKGQTEKVIGKRIGKTQEYVCVRIQLGNLEVPVKELLGEGKIKVSHAEQLTRIQDPELQVKIAKSIAPENLSVIRLGEKIDRVLQKTIPLVEQPSASSALRDSCEIKSDLVSLLEKFKAKEATGSCSKCRHSESCKQISKSAQKITVEEK